MNEDSNFDQFLVTELSKFNSQLKNGLPVI